MNRMHLTLLADSRICMTRIAGYGIFFGVSLAERTNIWKIGGEKEKPIFYV